MAKYRITDPQSGRSITVSGDQPPSQEKSKALLAQALPPESVVPSAPSVPATPPSPSALGLANEFIAGAARPLASMVDIAQSPYQAFRLYVQGKPVQSVRARIGERGAFAGPGLATDIAASSGELASTGISFTTGARALAANLLDDASRFGESAARGVLRQLGQSTPAKDVLAAVTGATGMEAGGSFGEAVGGANGRAVGELAGGFAIPLGAAPILSRLNGSVDNLLQKAAPDAKALRGAGRLLYQQIEDLGMVFNESATKKIVTSLQDVATKGELSGFSRDSPVAAQYRVAMDILDRPGPFTGTSYSMLDKASASFRDVAFKNKDNAGRIAGKLAGAIDDFLVAVEPSDLAYYRGAQTAQGSALAPVNQATLPNEDVAEVGKTLLNARGLWRRASAAQTIENAFKEANINALGPGAAEYDKSLAQSMRKMLTEEPSKFSREEMETITNALTGGSTRKTLEMLHRFGVVSDNYVLGSLMVAGGSMAARDSISDATAFTTGALLAAKTAMELNKKVVSNMFRTDVNMMKASIAAGPNARMQTRTYMSRVPAGKRKPAELAALLMSSGADLTSLEGIALGKSPFVADSLAFARALQAMQDRASAEQNE